MSRQEPSPRALWKQIGGKAQVYLLKEGRTPKVPGDWADYAEPITVTDKNFICPDGAIVHYGRSWIQVVVDKSGK